jgi:hypothetical protein
MDKNNIKSTLTEYLIPLDYKFMLQQIQHLKLDKYVKKLDSVITTQLFIFAQLKNIGSYAGISKKVKTSKKLKKIIGLESISTSQLSRKFRDMDPAFADSVFKNVVHKLFQQLGTSKAINKLGSIHLIDSSTISLCLTKYRWAEFRKTKAGIKLHLRFVYGDEGSYPDEAILTTARPADKKQMDALVSEDPNALNIFDRAYVDYRKFDLYCAKSIRFITRLKSNADITIIEERPLDPKSGVLRDATVRLGNKNSYLMEHPLRLIECLDSEGKQVMILTNDFKLSAQEISDLYRNRWQIELFFKWIKQHLLVKKCYGTSKNAVYNQIRISLITFCLTLLMQRKIDHHGKLLDVFTHLQLCWEDKFNMFLQHLFRPPSRKSKGRQRMKHDRIFEETLLQFEKGISEHLDDLIYDPVM